MSVILRYCILPLVTLLVAGKIVIWAFKWYPIQSGSVTLLLIGYGLVQGFIAQKGNNQRGWRTGSAGRDEIFYEEKIGGEWKRIMIYAEMLTGKVHRLIDLSSIEFPAWATDREDEIIGRIKSEYPPPRYEFQQAERAVPPNELS